MNCSSKIISIFLFLLTYVVLAATLGAAAASVVGRNAVEISNAFVQVGLAVASTNRLEEMAALLEARLALAGEFAVPLLAERARAAILAIIHMHLRTESLQQLSSSSQSPPMLVPLR